MQDIGAILNHIMEENQCSPILAFLILEGVEDGIHIQKSEPTEQFNRRLRDKSNQHIREQRLG